MSLYHARGPAILIALLFSPGLAYAEDAETSLRYDWKLDVAVVAVGGLTLVLSETVLKSELAPSACRWCDEELNRLDSGAREALRWSNTGAANAASNAMGWAAVPAAAFGLTALAADHDDRLCSWPIDALVMLEAAVISGALNQATKFMAGRKRTFVRAREASEGNGNDEAADDNLSFYSGHTNLAFTLAVSAGTVATLRRYRWAPAVWATGLAAAAATGYLRIAADRHYLTDVVTGAAAGSLLGFALPFFLHRPLGTDERDTAIKVTPLRDGAVLAWSAVW